MPTPSSRPPNPDTAGSGATSPEALPTGFRSDSVLGALRELESTGFSAADIVASTKPAMPAPWRRLAWWRRPFALVWLGLRLSLNYALRLWIGSRWLLGRWLKQRPGVLVQAAEVVFWPALFIYLCWVSHTANPFYINEGFPWPWMGVWLIALRYGALAGSIAALELLLVWYLITPAGPFPRLYFLGGAIMTLIAGEYGSLWGARSARFREATTYLNDKIDRLTRRLYLLKLSHDELEYEMVDRPGTLRDALVELRALLEAKRDSGQRLPSATVILEFLAQYCQIEAGGLYEYTDGPRPSLRKLAAVGNARAPEMDDPMVQRAIETGQSVHLQESLVSESRKLDLLLVAPIRDANGNTLGLLAINRMPFMALNPDNLRNIWVLLQSYAEYLRLSAVSLPYAQQWADAPTELRHEFAWLHRLQLAFGLQSWCVVWRCVHPQAADILEHIRLQHDHGEMAWDYRGSDVQAIICLLPFTSHAQVLVKQARITETLVRSFGAGMTENTLYPVDISMAQSDAWGVLRDTLVNA